jgi:ABC-2 type transport system permease protein
MFWTVFAFELKYRLRRPATYAYFGILFGITALLIADGGLSVSEKVNYNSPVAIGTFFTILGMICTLISSAVMGVPLFRDLEHHTKEYYLATPISRGGYFWGRFWGSFLILIFIASGAILGYQLGTVLGPILEWSEAERFGPNQLSHYLWPFVTIFVPSMFFTGAVFYSLVALTKNNRVLYSASILLFILYLLANFMVRDLEKRDLVDLLDPFALNTFQNAVKYMTPAEQNTQLVPLSGNFLINRLLWPGLGLILLLLTYFRFSLQRFIAAASRGKRIPDEKTPAHLLSAAVPSITGVFSQKQDWSNLWSLSRLEFRNIIKDTYFVSIILGAVLFLFLDDWIGNLQYGVPDRPVTMNMLLFKTYNYSLFVFILIMFYTGETVHRDKSTGFANIGDALPIPNWVQLGSKFISIAGICLLLATIPMLIGLLVQTLRGHFEYKLHYYLIDLYGITFWDYFQMALLAFFVHSLVNNKFAGHFVGLGIWIIMFLLQSTLQMDYNLFFYSYKPDYAISDMNGFGHFMQPLFWFNLYWTAFGAILLLLAALMWPRGTEDTFKNRRAAFRKSWNGAATVGFLSFGAIWLGAGAFIYHNVSGINKYRSSKENEKLQVSYEQKFKKYENLPQPKVTDVMLHADIFPEKRSMDLKAIIKIKNKNEVPVKTLHLLSDDGQRYSLSFDGKALQPSEVSLLPKPKFSFFAKSDTSGYRIFTLPRTMQPGDSATLVISTTRSNPGFVNEGYRREVVQNGTFSSSGIPSIGYDANGELDSDEKRKKNKLKPKPENLPEHIDPLGRRTLLFNDDADFITFECIVSTSPDQLAIAPGYLQKEWTKNGRRYFHYKQDNKIDYFFNVVSARYTVKRDKWTSLNGNTVNLEIYHHAEHTYNLDRMMDAMKDGLSYFHENFGPYQFRQVRILEFPRYAGFAQSFPNTIPYSEDFGWYADFSDPNDYDYFYYVTCHELAHQWWGHQVVPNKTRGSNLISESLAEYSALMIAQQKYGKDNLNTFLKYDLDGYLRGRANESKKEQTFINCNRGYQWYQKGSIILYGLQDYIGEKRLNGAIRAFRDSFGLVEHPPFPGSHDLFRFVKRVTPDSMHYYLEDTWKKITLYENRVLEAKMKDLGKNRYEVNLKVLAGKVYADEKGNEKPAANMNDYIDIGVFAEEAVDKNGKKTTVPLYLKKHRLKAGEQTIKVIVEGKKPVKAGIDPYNKLIDRIADDNRKEVSE